MAGETERRLYAVSVWWEVPFFSDQERAALAWAEAVTRLGEGGIPNEVYADACRYFTGRELIGLTMAIIAISVWNRLTVPFRIPLGEKD